MVMREWLARLLDWVRRDRLERELAEELRFHREHLERDVMSEGISAAEAPYAARRRLGNVTCVTEMSRERWSLPTLDQLLHDVRYALRGLRRSPGFTATAVVTLALGIGANVAMFGVIDRLMFRPYPQLRDPETVHRIYLVAGEGADRRIRADGLEYLRYLDLQRSTTSFARMAAFSHPMLAIGSGQAAREHRVATVSGTFWEFFEIAPALGRFFTPAEDSTPRGAEVAVLGYDFWQSELGGRNVLGERLEMGPIAPVIIGVAPRGFTGVSDLESPAVYLPITLYAGSGIVGERPTYFTDYTWGWLSVMARRKAGVTAEQASADVGRVHWQSWEAEREMGERMDPAEIARPTAIVGPMKMAAGPNPSLEARTASWLLGVAGIVLFIACANVANLFLARALRRQREVAVRLALGVSRRRLATQTLTESLLLSLLGSAAGLLIAQWGGTAIRRMLVASRNADVQVFTDWRTLAAVTGIAIVAAVITGLGPAALSGRGDLANVLKAGAREGTYRRSRIRVALLVTQGALSVVLLIGAALFVSSLQHARSMRLGYDADNALFVRRQLRGTKLDSAELVAQRRALVAAARSIPGVTHAAWMYSVPLRSTASTSLYVPGVDSVERFGRFSYQLTTADYFEAMGTRLVRGRGFTDADREGTPRVAVVSESMARVLWPEREAIGQCLQFRSRTAMCSTVIGVAEDIVQREEQLNDQARLHYYLPIEQVHPERGTFVLIRMRADAASQAETVRRQLQAVMPGESYVTVTPLAEAVEGVQRSWRLGATLFVAFGILALAVATVGLYGVVAYNVTQRMHELGVRVALGARTPDILKLVVGQSARFALAGVAVGCLLALAASRWVQPLLFRQSATDPAIYTMIGAIMLTVALAAAAVPAFRAVRADPNTALRVE